MDYQLNDPDTILKSYGRGVIFYAVDEDGDPTVWDGTSELNLEPLGLTEGDLNFSPNGNVATLTLPEITGDAIHEAKDLGEAPVLEFPMFLADPDLLPIISPRGSAHAGYSRVCDVAERTIVVFPEELFKVSDDPCLYGDLAYTLAEGWTLNGTVLTSAQETLLELTYWLWRGYFQRPDTGFRGGHGDDGKALYTASFMVMDNPSLPNGHRLYTRGDPATYGISIEGAS